MEKYFWKLKGALGLFFVLVLEKLRQVNSEVFAGCPCRKCLRSFNIFSRKPAMIILGLAFFTEYIHQLTIACLLSL